MAAAMNGLALHGGIIPVRRHVPGLHRLLPARRSACRRSWASASIYVMTHDSIGLGEDGPTHQPVEHLAALRAIPNLNVFRPADAVETAECWELALQADAERPRSWRSRARRCRRCARSRRREPVRQGRLRSGRDRRGQARRDASSPRARRSASPWRRASCLAKDGDQGRGRVDAVLRTVRGAARSLSRGRAGRRAARRRRGRRGSGWDEWLRRQAACSSACRASAPRRPRPSSTSTSASRRQGRRSGKETR